MSVKIMSLCFAAKFGSPTRFAVAIALADHAHDDGTSVYPSVSWIAHKADVSLRTAQYTLRSLEKEGLLTVVSKGGARPGDTREWKFNIAKLEQMGAKTAPVDGCKPRSRRVQTTVKRGATVAPKPSLTGADPSNASEPRARADATRGQENVQVSAADEIGGLNGATAAIVQGVGTWLNHLAPDLPTARRIVASNVGLYGADAVRRGFADMQTDVIDGKVIGSPLKAFTAYCDKAKTGRHQSGATNGTHRQGPAAGLNKHERVLRAIAESNRQLGIGAD